MIRCLLLILGSLLWAGCPPPRLEAPPVAGALAFPITSEPVGAELTVDGIPRGITPQTVPLGAGTHRVKLSKSGYFVLETTVEVREGGSFTGKLVASH